MKTLLSFLLLFSMACEEEKICWREVPGMCHTRAEWDQITKDNLAGIDCFNKNIKRFKNSIEKTDKFCGMKEISRIEFR